MSFLDKLSKKDIAEKYKTLCNECGCSGCMHLYFYNNGEAFCDKGNTFASLCVKHDYCNKECPQVKMTVVPKIPSSCYRCIHLDTSKDAFCKKSINDRNECLENNHKFYKCIEMNKNIF